MMPQVVKNLCHPLDGNVMLLGEVGRPRLDGRTVLHCLRHPRRERPFALAATRRTYRDFSAMRRDFNTDGRNIEHLALFIIRRLDAHQGGLTMLAGGGLVKLDLIRMVPRVQGVPLVTRLTTVGLGAGLP